MANRRMAAGSVKKRRSSGPRRRIRAAYERAQELLGRLAYEASSHKLENDPEIRPLLDQVREEVALLALSPKMRIVAVRRRQGAASRRQTAAELLFAAATEVRRRIKIRYRGP